MRRKREKERIEQMEGERKLRSETRKERETERVRLILPPHAIPHTRASLVPLRAPPPQDVDSHECTNTSRDLKPLRLLLPPPPPLPPRQPHHDPTFSPSPPPIDSGRRCGAPALLSLSFSSFCFIFIILSLFLVLDPLAALAPRDAADTRNKHRAKQPGAESPIISHGKLYVNAPLMASFVNGIAVVAEGVEGDDSRNTARLARAIRILS